MDRNFLSRFLEEFSNNEYIKDKIVALAYSNSRIIQQIVEDINQKNIK